MRSTANGKIRRVYYGTNKFGKLWYSPELSATAEIRFIVPVIKKKKKKNPNRGQTQIKKKKSNFNWKDEPDASRAHFSYLAAHWT